MRLRASSPAFALALLSVTTVVRAKEPATPTPAAFDWSGVWAVFDEGVDLVNLTVAPDGTAATTRVAAEGGAPEVGRWEATEDAIFVRYDSGRGETILRHASGFRHVARIEDADTRERRTRVGAAFQISSPTVPFVGAWRAGANGGGSTILLRSDGSGDRVGETSTTGTWIVAGDRARIRWQDGAEESFDPQAAGIRRAETPCREAS